MDFRIGVGDPQAIRKYSAKLAFDIVQMSYFKKFTGRTENSIVMEMLDLESSSGDVIQYDLSMGLRGEGVAGDDIAEGREEAPEYLIDEIRIDQIRKPIAVGSKMSRQRTIHDIRRNAKNHGAEWMAAWLDELIFCYASGVAGNAANVLNERSNFRFASWAGNPIQAPDAGHLVYGGAATSKASLVGTDKMTVDLVRRLAVKAQMLGSRNPNVVELAPVDVDGEKCFVLVMSPDQDFDLRTAAGPGDWMEIQKHSNVKSGSNPLFTGATGKIDNVVLHKHQRIRRMGDYGAGASVEAHRALFMGRQAVGLAWGADNSGNGTRIRWVEKLKDYDDKVSISGGMVVGAKKTRFRRKDGGGGTDYGVIAVDTAAKASYA